MEDLSRLRESIDALDERLVELLSQRAELAVRAGRIKKAAGLDILDPARESEIIERLTKISQGTILKDEIRNIFSAIIKACRELQKHQT